MTHPPSERPSLLAPFEERARQRIETSASASDWLPMFSVREKGGLYYAFPWSDIIWVNFDPEVGIQLHFSTHTVTVRGHRLDNLYKQMAAHRVRHVEVTPEGAGMLEEDAPDIEAIHVKQNKRRGEEGESWIETPPGTGDQP